MAKQRKHSSSKVSDFFDYLGGKLSGKERNAFERRLQKDPFEAEASEGLGMVTRAEMEEDLHAASAKIRWRIRRKHRIAWYSTAAAVASLMIVATIFFNVDDGGMDRYSTAPEFEEAVQEQPGAVIVEKKRTRKDAIPEAEELQEGLMQDDDKLQEELRQDKDLVQGERLRQDEDRVLEEPSTANVEKKRTRKDAIPEAEVLQERLVLDEDGLQEELRQEESTQRMNAMEVVDGENIAVAMDEKVATAAEVNATKRAVGENTDDEIVFVERDADAAERSKRTAPVAQDVPTAQKYRQDEIPDMEEIEPLEDHVQLDEVVVVGHASSKKTSLTSAVSRVETDPVTQNEYITASPVDGITAYREYIDTTLVYPAETETTTKEVVVLKFSVTPFGRPENFRVIRSPGDTFSQEAIRVISEGPDWKPTTSNGTYVDDEVRLRVVFRTDK